MTDVKGNEFVGRAGQMKGKMTTIAFQGQKHPGNGLRHVKVVGRPDPTNPEKAQNEFILLVMRGTKTLRDSPFIRMVWFPHWKPLNIEPIIVNFQDADSIVTKIGLNESQRAAVHAMVGALPLVVVHGACRSDLRDIFRTVGLMLMSRSTWYGQDHHHCCSFENMGPVSSSRMDCCPFKCCSQKHRRNTLQKRCEFQTSRFQRILCGMVSQRQIIGVLSNSVMLGTNICTMK
jgi:hypothetical protein